MSTKFVSQLKSIMRNKQYETNLNQDTQSLNHHDSIIRDLCYAESSFRKMLSKSNLIDIKNIRERVKLIVIQRLNCSVGMDTEGHSHDDILYSAQELTSTQSAFRLIDEEIEALENEQEELAEAENDSPILVRSLPE